MHTVSLFEAKARLSRLVDALLEGKGDEVVIARRGRPVARVIPLHTPDTAKRIGVARGRFKVPENIDRANPMILSLVAGRGDRE